MDDGSRFPDNRGTFSENHDFSESSDKDPEFEVRIKSQGREGVEHIRIKIRRNVATHKYCCICYEVQDLTVVIGRKNTSFYRFDMGKYYRTARNSDVSAKQSNPRYNTSSRHVLIKIKIRKLQQNDCDNFAIRTRATSFRLCHFHHESL